MVHPEGTACLTAFRVLQRFHPDFTLIHVRCTGTHLADSRNRRPRSTGRTLDHSRRRSAGEGARRAYAAGQARAMRTDADMAPGLDEGYLHRARRGASRRLLVQHLARLAGALLRRAGAAACVAWRWIRVRTMWLGAAFALAVVLAITHSFVTTVQTDPKAENHRFAAKAARDLTAGID